MNLVSKQRRVINNLCVIISVYRPTWESYKFWLETYNCWSFHTPPPPPFVMLPLSDLWPMYLCMWQSLPGPSLPPCSVPPTMPLCALPSPQVGDQILEVNGRNFLSIPHDEAVRILKSSRHLMMTVKDVGRLPHARTVVGETKWIASSQIAESSANSSMAGWVLIAPKKFGPSPCLISVLKTVSRRYSWLDSVQW